MKRSFKILIVFILAILLAGVGYWQFVKKGVLKDIVQTAVKKQTESLYYIHYDSSYIDEVKGDATFYKVVLQSDSLQEKLYTNDTSVSSTIFNVRIEQVNIRGANIPSFLQKSKIEADIIEIIRPVITIIKTGKDEPIKLTGADSLALYDRITGKFKSIQAKEIRIVDATIAFANGKKAPHTTLQDVSVTLKNFKIDSTHNYDNLVSYFIKDVVATVKIVSVNNEKNDKVLEFDNVQYNAPGKFLSIGRIFQKNNSRVLLEFRNNSVKGISTNDFIVNKKIKADSLSSDGGVLTLSRNKSTGNKKGAIEIDNEFFDEALIRNIRISNTTVQLYNKAKPQEAPLILKNLKFNASGIQNIYDGTNLKKLIASSNWNLGGNGLSWVTSDNVYRITVGPFLIDKEKSSVRINQVAVTPLLSEAAFVKTLKIQKDRFEGIIKNIVIIGTDVQALLDGGNITAETISIEPNLKVFNDRTVPFDKASKVGKYPHQQIVKLETPMYIKKLLIKNGYVSYKERGALSKQVGNVFFTNVNGTVTNVTNMKDRISVNNIMVLQANTKFMGIADINTTWRLPLNTTNGAFTASGTSGPFDASKLSAITEPLGIASIKKGTVDGLTFNLEGTDTKATGKSALLYHNLKVALLKGNSDSTKDLKKRGLLSFVANILIKDQNPSNGVTRVAKIDHTRDITKSFFNLLWKSIFDGAKKTVAGKNDY